MKMHVWDFTCLKYLTYFNQILACDYMHHGIMCYFLTLESTNEHLIIIILISACLCMFLDEEKQLFWNLKFHAVLSTVFSQLILMLICYSAVVSSWRPLTSLVPKWKHTPSARWGRDASITPLAVKTQDCNIFCTPTQMKYHSLFRMSFW